MDIQKIINYWYKKFLSMVKKRIPIKIKESIKDYIKVLEEDKLPIREVILFGSYAKKPHKWSDIDLCIISPKFKDNFQTWEYLWKKRGVKDIDAMIAPIGYHPKDFVDEDPLVWEIKKTGIRIM